MLSETILSRSERIVESKHPYVTDELSTSPRSGTGTATLCARRKKTGRTVEPVNDRERILSQSEHGAMSPSSMSAAWM
jgi:hypothetical protein